MAADDMLLGGDEPSTALERLTRPHVCMADEHLRRSNEGLQRLVSHYRTRLLAALRSDLVVAPAGHDREGDPAEESLLEENARLRSENESLRETVRRLNRKQMGRSA